MIKRYSLIAGFFMFFTNIYCQNIGDYRTKQSGNWNQCISWERYDGNAWVIPWDTLVADKYPDLTNDSGRFFNVSILSSHTITLTVSGMACKNLLVEQNGKLYANNNGKTTRYIEIYGDIECNGIIGNGSTFDIISFEISGNTCTIFGTGSFDCSILKKSISSTSDTSVNLTIARDINLTGDATVLHNSKNNTNFNVTINAGVTVTLTDPVGSVAIDGSNGKATAKCGGHIQVFGTLIIPHILYLSADNNRAGAGPFPCSVTIGENGKIKTGLISIIESNDDGHYFNMKSGAELEITGDTNAFINFSAVNNYYNLDEGSTIIYSSNINTPVNVLANDTFPYQNLKFTGNGNRDFTNTLTINGDFNNELSSGNFTGTSSPQINLKGNWTSTSHTQFDENGIEVNFIGNGTQIIDANSDYEEFDKITIDNGSFVLVKDSISFNDIILTDGTLKVNKGISILNNYTGSNSSFISFAGNNNFGVSGSGTITDFYVSQDTLGTTNRIQNFTVNKSSNDFKLNNQLQVTKLIYHTDGEIKSDGFLKLISNSETEYAQISGDGNGNITGNIIAEFTVPHSRGGASGTGEWIQLGSPLNGITLADIDDDIYVNYGTPATFYQSVFYYDETEAGNAGAWRPAISSDGMDEKGYALFIPSDNNLSTNDLLTITGTYSKGNFTTSALTETGSFNDSSGYHLLANPWPSGYDHNGASITNLKANTIYIYHGDTAKTHNGTTGTWNGIVPPFHALYVKIDGNNNTLTFDASQRTTDYQTNYFYKKNPLDNIIRLFVHSDFGSDETIIYTDDNAHNGLDNLDVRKRFNTGKVPNLYSTIENEKTVMQLINEFPTNDDMQIPIGFSATENGNYELSLMIEAFENTETKFYLEDILLNKITEISQKNYSFSHDKNNNANRFVLHLKNNEIKSTIAQNEMKESYEIIYDGEEINIKNNLGKDLEIIIFDAIGRTILTQKTSQNSIHIDSALFAKGIYYVQINSSQNTYTKKILID